MLNKDHIKVSEAIYFGYNILPNFNRNAIVSVINHPTISFTTTLLEALGIFIGCQLPDIDIPQSKIGQCVKPLSKLLNKFGHRGITHSLWFLLAISLIMLIAKPTILHPFYICIAIGVLLHLLEDSFSKAGVIWLFPLGRYRKWHNTFCKANIHTTFRYRTGGTTEKFIGNIALALCYIEMAFYIYFMFQ